MPFAKNHLVSSRGPDGSSRGATSPRAAVAGDVPRRQLRWFWPTIVATAYAAAVAVVTAAEYVSEMAKLGRGTFTDTFSPYLFSDLLTLPVSGLHPARVDYPATFSAAAGRDLLQQALVPTLINVLAEAVVIAAVGIAWTTARRAR